jgi:hypothetical protein
MDHATTRCVEPKLFRKSDWLICGAGNWRVIELMRYACDLPRPGSDPHRTLCLDVRAEFDKACTEHGFELALDDADGEPHQPYWFLFSDGEHLWQIDYSGHAERLSVAAIGTGAEYALGWLARSDVGSPSERIKGALRATAARYGMLTGPYPVEAA